LVWIPAIQILWCISSRLIIRRILLNKVEVEVEVAVEQGVMRDERRAWNVEKNSYIVT
jgi:hypothetical protein